MIGPNIYFADLPGRKASDNTYEMEINEILLKIISLYQSALHDPLACSVLDGGVPCPYQRLI